MFKIYKQDMGMIIGDYVKSEIYNDVYEYSAPEGYHFESEGTNYGRHIYGGEVLSNLYVIKKDKIIENEKN